MVIKITEDLSTDEEGTSTTRASTSTSSRKSDRTALLSPAMVRGMLPTLRARFRQYGHDIILQCVPRRESAVFQPAVGDVTRAV